MRASRLDRLRSAMAERQLDAVLVVKPENRAYLSGFTGSSAWLLISRERACLITDFRYIEQAGAQAKGFEIVKRAATQFPTIAELVAQMGVSKLGYEGNYLTVEDFHQYESTLKAIDLVSISGLVESFRTVKDAEEIEAMARAAAITDAAWSHIITFIRPGVAERDVAAELEYYMRKQGAEGFAFETHAISGVNTALPHGMPTDKLIESGDLVTCDFGALYKGYCADMTRTVMVGQPTDKQREIYEIVLEANMRGLAACRAGMTGKELDEVCRSYIRDKGYGEYFGHGTGHGVGRFIHEGPRVSALGENDVLEPGNVVTIEPGIYLPGWGGVRIEDMVLVQENGCRRLSQSPKDLLIL